MRIIIDYDNLRKEVKREREIKRKESRKEGKRRE